MAGVTKYNADIQAKAEEYADNWQATGDRVPQIASLAIACGIGKNTLYEWEKLEGMDKWRDVCARVRVAQEKELINAGLDRTNDSGLTKLMLMKHGYTDKQEIDHTTKGERLRAITDDDLDNRLKGLGIDPDAIK